MNVLMHRLGVILLIVLAAPVTQAVDLETIEPDLTTPQTIIGDPAPGRRVKQTNEAYAGPFLR